MAQVFKSVVIAAPVEHVWSKIRDFNDLPEWHPGIRESHIEGGGRGDAVGSVRRLTLTDGAEIREQLTALSDSPRSCEYRMLESPLPISNYSATLSLRPITLGNHTYAEWCAGFDVASEQEAEMIELLGEGVFQTGLARLAEMLA